MEEKQIESRPELEFSTDVLSSRCLGPIQAMEADAMKFRREAWSRKPND